MELRRPPLAEGSAVWMGLGLEEMLSEFDVSSGGRTSSTSDTESNETPRGGVDVGRGVGMDDADSGGPWPLAMDLIRAPGPRKLGV